MKVGLVSVDGTKLNANASKMRSVRYDRAKELLGHLRGMVEPVFGIIKNVLKFKRFSLWGLEKIHGEWELVALSYNMNGCIN